MAALVLPVIRRTTEAGGAAALALGSAGLGLLGLPFGSTADSLRGQGNEGRGNARDGGHLLLMCAHPLEGESPHTCKAWFVKSGEQK